MRPDAAPAVRGGFIASTGAGAKTAFVAPLLASGLALLLAASSALAPAAAASPLALSVSADYSLYRNGGHIVEMREHFETRDGEYRISSESHAVGLMALFERQPLRFTSEGHLTEAGLRPRHFEGKRSDADRRRVRAEFDWQAGRLTIEHDGRTETLPLARGAQDRLSLMYQFMFLAPEQQQRMEIAMTNGRKLGHYQYTVQAGVEIETPLGRMTTLHVVKQRRPDESATEIWLSPGHRFLPVKMLVVEEDGVRYEQVATRLEIKSP